MLEHVEVKAKTLHDIGVRVDDFLEGAKRELAECNGAKTAGEHIARRLAEMSKALDVEMAASEGKLEKEAYDLQKKVWAEALAIVQQVAYTSNEQYLRCQGKISALENTVKWTKNLHDAASAQADAMRRGDLVEEDSGKLPGAAPGDAAVIPLRRMEGTHPGNPLEVLRGRGEGPKDGAAQAQDELKDPGLGPTPPVRAKPSRKPTRKPRE